MPLDIVIATGPLLDEWRAIHNAIIPTDPLSADEVAERAGRNRLTLGYAAGALVGNATVRPPAGPDAVATVIVRILPEHRRQGFGTQYLAAEALPSLAALSLVVLIVASIAIKQYRTTLD